MNHDRITNPIVRATQHSRSAFTLIELLVVVGIIAVLTALLIPAAMLVRDRGKRSIARQAIAQIHNAVEVYRVQTQTLPPVQGGDFPPQERERLSMTQRAPIGLLTRLEAVTDYRIDGSQLGPNLGEGRRLLTDPWGEPYLAQGYDEWRGAASASTALAAKAASLGVANGSDERTGERTGIFIYSLGGAQLAEIRSPNGGWWTDEEALVYRRQGE